MLYDISQYRDFDFLPDNPPLSLPHPQLPQSATSSVYRDPPGSGEDSPLFPQASSYCYRDLKKAFYNTKLSLGAIGWMEKNNVWRNKKKFTTEERKLIRALKTENSRKEEESAHSKTSEVANVDCEFVYS